ncbi:hypothetical protein TVAG_233120 [Trichomonas vaginalis G3]|uniref:Uncharacterized protein n=1 Tax=Trichomonas vaginalis (strain ATCC PRA-98 / G3) TaxID=412133 RepID=A2ERY1_TRIV3|nr:nucleotide-diphospho-sugar transferases family [Trichomonas vaginalis G3]EAY04576.1 hypothetical protein TVAG_233120 [Trichomonas vaginalis G3]KAI5516075.1 nucleotide-diphospho-sugar transferases family [Trichomonas vaginalis G3]|eukprot:XP_001316799.1 hypothetical protein [Trichomonas vaginalis G3]
MVLILNVRQPIIEEINTERELFILNRQRPCTLDRNMDLIGPPSYIHEIGTKEWTDIDLENKLSKIDWSECPNCDLIHRPTKVNSTSRDFIIVAMINCSNNLQGFLRSLRSTGSRAMVVLFCDELAMKQLSDFHKDLIQKCGAILINIGKMPTKFLKKPFENRHPLFYTFLYKYRKLIDRVIMVDLLDVYFQEDPFTPDFNSSTFAATTEMVKFSTCPINTEWISVADPNYDPYFYADKTPLCFGMVYGCITCFLKFYDIIFKQKPWKNFQISTIDQGYLNYYFYKGIFSRNGLFVAGSKAGDKIISTRGGNVSSKVGPYGEMLMEGSDNVPAILHHYNRHCKLWQDIHRKCKLVGSDSKAYAKQKEMTEKCPLPD